MSNQVPKKLPTAKEYSRVCFAFRIEPQHHITWLDEDKNVSLILRRETDGSMTAFVSYLGGHHMKLSKEQVLSEIFERLIIRSRAPSIPVPIYDYESAHLGNIN